MKRNKKFLIVIFILFMGLMIYLSYDMASKTVKPWGKKNNVLKKYNSGRK